MQQIRFWLGLCPRPCHGGAHSAPPNPQLDLKGPTSEKREGEGGLGSGGKGRVFTVRRSALHGLCDRNSVRLSVCHTRGLYPHGSTYDHDFFTIW